MIAVIKLSPNRDFLIANLFTIVLYIFRLIIVSFYWDEYTIIKTNTLLLNAGASNYPLRIVNQIIYQLLYISIHIVTPS